MIWHKAEKAFFGHSYRTKALRSRAGPRTSSQVKWQSEVSAAMCFRELASCSGSHCIAPQHHFNAIVSERVKHAMKSGGSKRGASYDAKHSLLPLLALKRDGGPRREWPDRVWSLLRSDQWIRGRAQRAPAQTNYRPPPPCRNGLAG
jgi:hypothetical protein